jgi:hypothetical protein
MDNFTEKNLLDMMVISNTLINKYEEWGNNEEIMSTLNSEKNTIKSKLKEIYNDIDEKVLNAISLSYIMYLYISVMKLCN